MKLTLAAFMVLSALSINACATHPSTTPTNSIDNVPTKTATPSGEKSRLLDCIGENQTTKGNTRPDCLPNDADGAARDTEAGAGGSPLRP